MFGLFSKNPIARLEREYNAKLQKSRDLQRNGDVVGAAKITAEAEKIRDEIARLEASRAKDARS
ncbi:MAG: DUF6435 family protein [Planctomycetota bacterium]